MGSMPNPGMVHYTSQPAHPRYDISPFEERPSSSSGPSRYSSTSTSTSFNGPDSSSSSYFKGQKRSGAELDGAHEPAQHKRFASWSASAPRPSLPPLAAVTRSPPQEYPHLESPRLSPISHSEASAEQRASAVQWPRVAECLTRVVEASQYVASSAASHLQSRTLPPLESIRAMQNTCYSVQSSLDLLASNRSSSTSPPNTAVQLTSVQLKATPSPTTDTSMSTSWLSHPGSYGQPGKYMQPLQGRPSLQSSARPTMRSPGAQISMLTDSERLSHSASHGAPQDRPLLPQLRPGSVTEDGTQGSIWERGGQSRSDSGEWAPPRSPAQSSSFESHLSFAPPSVRNRFSGGDRPTYHPEARRASQAGYTVLPHLQFGSGSSLDSTSTPPESASKMIRTTSSKSLSGGSGDRASEPPSSEETVNKYRKRSRAPAPGACQSCGTNVTPEWRRGPDGLRTLCNACGLHYSKVKKRSEAASSSKSSRSPDPAFAPRQTPASPGTVAPPRTAEEEREGERV